MAVLKRLLLLRALVVAAVEATAEETAARLQLLQ
jgi:hypothetical protein